MNWDEASKELQKKLDPSHVKPPPQGKYGSYIEGWHAIAEANRIFGHGGWSYTIDHLTQTNATQDAGKHRIGYMAVVTVAVGDVRRGDVGHGQGFGKSEGDAHDSAVKEAVTDALKRALRTFGNPFGLALYDKSGANVGRPDAPEQKTKKAADIVADINQCATLDQLRSYWEGLSEPAKQHPKIEEAKEGRWAELGAMETHQGAG